LTALPDDEVEAYVLRTGLDRLIAFERASHELGLYDNLNPADKTPFPAQWRDLVRLHRRSMRSSTSTATRCSARTRSSPTATWTKKTRPRSKRASST
jgi:hypothetical protein